MTVGRQPDGVVTIDGQPYFLAKDPQTGAPGWHDRMVATQEGDPTTPRRFRWNDWSRGMGDSRGIFQGAVESATGAFLGAIGRILPGPKIHTISTGHDVAVTAFVEVTLPAARVISFGGRYGKEINPATQTVATTKDFGAGKTVTGAALFIDQVAIAMGEATQFQRRDASGTYAASTTTSDANGDYRYATSFGISAEGDLARGRSYFWSKCAAADFYGTNGNWTVEFDIGDKSVPITQVGNFERWDYVFKQDGLFTFDSTTSKESNVLPDLSAFKSAENKRWFAWFNRLFLCTFAGLYRYIQQGGARTVGIEEAELNEGLMTNAYPTAGVAFGKWAYVAYYDPALNTTYVCMMRNSRDGDANFGSPFTVVSIIDSFTGKCNAMCVSSAPGTPTVYYGRDVDVSYFQISRTGRPIEYQDSGSTVVTLSPSDLASPMTVKYARGFEVIGRNASAARTIQLALAWDGGSFNNVGTSIQSFTSSFATRFLTAASNDSGRVPQLKVTMGLDSTTVPPEVRDVVFNYEERPLQVPGALMQLRFRDNDSEGGVTTRLSAVEQMANLMALFGREPVDFTDPYGNTYKAAFHQWHSIVRASDSDTDEQNSGGFPQGNATMLVRRLDYQ